MEDKSRILIVGETPSKAEATAELLAVGILTKYGVRVRAAHQLQVLRGVLYGLIPTPAAEVNTAQPIGREAALKCTLFTVEASNSAVAMRHLERMQVPLSSIINVNQP